LRVDLRKSRILKPKLQTILEQGRKSKMVFELSPELKEWRAKLDAIQQGLRKKLGIAPSQVMGDVFHDMKRRDSFKRLEYILDSCSRKDDCCSLGELDRRAFYLLSDISLAGYLLEKTSQMAQEGAGSSHMQRWSQAADRIKCVFNCGKVPQPNTLPFELDAKELMDAIKCPQTYKGVRNRKAYWSHMADASRSDPTGTGDYLHACGFIERMHSIAHKKDYRLEDLHTTRMLLEQNFHVANGIDLLRFCIIRGRIAIQS
jgi:hypothetical protein